MSRQITLKDARIRNLIFKILKYAKENNEAIDFLNSNYDEEKLKRDFYFTESDMKNHVNELFQKRDNKYCINEKCKDKINEYFQNYLRLRAIDLEELKGKYIECFQQAKSLMYQEEGGNEGYREKQEGCIEIIKKLHWIVMPQYNEQMIINRECLPEDIEEYYNHYHAIEDMYLEVTGKGVDWKSKKGDENLNKKLKFKVYSERWGNYDVYTIERTINGWNAYFLAQHNKGVSKDGSDSIIPILEHDSIDYPKELKYCLELLWDSADSDEMTIDELQDKIDELAKWVSEVEKVTKDFQPSWYC